MTAPDLRALVDYYLPLLVAAGDYALAIQPRVREAGSKAGINAWASAVTDADLAIQNFIEVTTLARDPRLGFFGEESGQSANTRYFSADAETVVHLDPVNATFLYQNRRDGWDIMLSISHARQLRAVISYMPARGSFYLAVDGTALAGRRDDPRLRAMRPLVLPESPPRVCLTYRAKEVVSALRPAFDAFDLVEDDDPSRGLDHLNTLFSGGIAAFACHGGDMLDWGALGYIVRAAGGVATRLDGAPLAALEDFDPEHKEDLLVAANAAIHAEILDLLAIPR